MNSVCGGVCVVVESNHIFWESLSCSQNLFEWVHVWWNLFFLEFGWCGRSDRNGRNLSDSVGSSMTVGGGYGRESMDSFSFEEMLTTDKFCWENSNVLYCIF